MANEQKIKIPDIGGAEGVDVIEVLVKEGDSISQDTSLITLESDKASMEIPAPVAGIVKKLMVKIGDKVSEGDDILVIETEAGSNEVKKESSQNQSEPEVQGNKERVTEPSSNATSTAPMSESIESIKIPDIGGAADVDVIDIMVKEGDMVEVEQSLLTLEGDKATMDIPCPKAGKVKSIHLKIGDKVSQNDPILELLVASHGESTVTQSPEPPTKTRVDNTAEQPKSIDAPAVISKSLPNDQAVHAGPAVRRLAHELGVNLNQVTGSGRKGRITKEDLVLFVKNVMEKGGSGGGLSIPLAPAIDFSKFGEIEVKPLNKIKRLTGENVHRSWVTIPHVTQFDEADITELEAFRSAEKEGAKKAGYNLTIIAFVTKALYLAMKTFPQFNASLSPDGKDLIYKSYYNIGIAVDTPNGLVVPVIKGVDKLSVADIAREMGRLSQKAREKGLMPNDMSGGCMTISSLGGIGGTAFTPIVNSPEVAILGLSRSYIKPVFQQDKFVPRLMLPLSLSYDHRVIDGAEAARFSVYLADILGDIRKIILG
ncbi:dihydrolipoyllysine-residue acetyltransferase [Legionella sp. W05-934-2]|uniref:dihydrolipoyllysine-residue acetyltransferase n=1 Tax=Legionella sp. W05-934-2 TaxID=1198649 RepID=UPI0034629297